MGLLAALAGCLVAAPAQAAPQPKMTAVKAPPKLAVGGRYKVTSIVTNRSGSRVRGPITLTLSKDRKPGAVKLGSRRATASGKGRSRIVTRATLKKSIAVGRYFLVSCFGFPGGSTCAARRVTVIKYVNGARSGGDSLFPEIGNGGYDALHYEISLDYDPLTNQFNPGTYTKMTARATEYLRQFSLDFEGPEISRIEVNRRRSNFIRRGTKLIITPRIRLDAGRRFTVKVEYSGYVNHHVDPDESLEGWVRACRSGDPGPDNPDCFGSFTVSEPIGAQTWFPNNNVPSDKATFTTTTAVPTEAGADDIRFQTQTSYYVQRTLERLGIQALEARLVELLNQTTGEAQAEAARLGAARDRLRRMVRAVIDQRYELYGRPATEQFLTEVALEKSLAQISNADMPRMKVAVARMAKRLAVKHSRRQRVQLKGQLDIRRTLRANAGRDSVPFDLLFRYKRRDKPKIVAVCDVSGSVSAHVRFLLLFLYAMNQTVTDLRTFAFSNALHDCAGPLERLPFEDAMAHILREYGGGGTDYGAAFETLEADHWEEITRQTTVLILGDGRSNNTPPRLDLFREMADRAKRVVWLCTEAPPRWGTGDSYMLKYLPFCTHVSHVATVTDLERAVDEVLEAY